jgi:predicted alpha/beta hydrolase family esterase
MKNAIILHGKCGKQEYYSNNYPSLSNSHWLPWLQKQLLMKDIHAVTPEVPNAFDPDWQTWVKEVERYEIGPDTLLVGHSCGGGFWVKYLSLNKDLKVGKVVLVAPWMDPDGDETNGFFNDFQIDPQIASRTARLTIYHSDNDMGNVHKTVATLRESLKDYEYKEFQNYGHFTYGAMKGQEFPELLDDCLK